MTITINEGNTISTTLYEKAYNLHLYIPAMSAHPPGLLPGLVNSCIFRIYSLCSDKKDRVQKAKEFYRRLQNRGWPSDKLIPLFRAAIVRAKSNTGRSVPATQDDAYILHFPYHPRDPPPGKSKNPGGRRSSRRSTSNASAS